MEAAECIAAQCLASPLRLLHRAVNRVYDDALRPVGLTLAQLNLLVRIERMGEQASPSRISRALLLEKSTLSRDLARMEAEGWVKRRPLEGRSRALELTTRGRRLVTEAFPRWEQAQATARARFGPMLGSEIKSLASRALSQSLE